MSLKATSSIKVVYLGDPVYPYTADALGHLCACVQ